jgi:hypothetical protein
MIQCGTKDPCARPNNVEASRAVFEEVHGKHSSVMKILQHRLSTLKVLHALWEDVSFFLSFFLSSAVSFLQTNSIPKRETFKLVLKILEKKTWNQRLQWIFLKQPKSTCAKAC